MIRVASIVKVKRKSRPTGITRTAKMTSTESKIERVQPASEKSEWPRFKVEKAPYTSSLSFTFPAFSWLGASRLA